jgi:ribose transport system substrate-binding protein
VTKRSMMRVGILLVVIVIMVSMVMPMAMAKDKLVIAYVTKALNNIIDVPAKVGAEKAAQELGVDVIWAGPVQTDAAKQVEVVEGLIQRGVDAIAISAIDPNALKSVIDQAVNAGIKVITWDSDSPQSKRAFYYGTDNYKGGYQAGKLLAKYMGNKGTVAILTGVPGSLNLEERIRGFKDAIKGTQMVVKTVLPCDDDVNKAVEVVESYTRANPDLGGWFFVGGWPLIAPKEALGFLEDFKGKIVSFDTLPSELDFVKAGVVDGLIGQRFYAMGYDGVKFLVDMIRNGKTFSQKVMDSGVDIVTKENVDEYMKFMESMK